MVSSALEKTAIVAAVAQHRCFADDASPLGKLLYEADKVSRPCYACVARERCDWLPEKMNVECSNELLKLLEEPPVQTVFLLVSEEPDALLQTIQSRTQHNRFLAPGLVIRLPFISISVRCELFAVTSGFMTKGSREMAE